VIDHLSKSYAHLDRARDLDARMREKLDAAVRLIANVKRLQSEAEALSQQIALARRASEKALKAHRQQEGLG